MHVMSDGLRVAAGATLRTMLTKATDNRLSGLLMGPTLGTLIQSSATAVMIVGFINAGLMILPQSIVPMLGANIGMALSTQLISIRLNERVVDDVKLAMKEYLLMLTQRTLSQRQSLLVQTIDRWMADIERIGDHIDELADITTRRHKHPAGRFGRDILTVLAGLYEQTAKVLHLVSASLNVDRGDFQAQAEAILQARDAYVNQSMQAKEAMTDNVVHHDVLPVTGVFFSEYVAALDRIVKHAKLVALAEKQPYFFIKRRQLERTAREVPQSALPPKVDTRDFMDQLQWENYPWD